MAETSYPRAGVVSGQNSLLHLPRWNESGTGLRAAIVLHGHGATCVQAAQGTAAFGDHPNRLADQGFAVLAVDLAQSGWQSPANMTILDNAYANLVSVVGGVAGTTKVALCGWSAGAGNALNWIKRNPSKVSRAWLFNPVTDLDWIHATAGYTPAYSTGGVTPIGSWPAEVDTAFSGNYAANAPGYKIRDEYASWHGLSVPIMVCQASGDTVLPPLAASAFVTGVNDPNVTLRSPTPTGGHANLTAIPTAEVVGWLAQP